MVKITIEAPSKQVAAKEEIASAREIVMSIIARRASSLESITDLVGKQVYAQTIDLLRHQTDTAMQVLSNFSHRVLLADEVGLGKTIEAGIILKEYLLRRLVRKILILTPAPLKYQWQQEMRDKFREEFHVVDDPADYARYDKLIVSIDTAKTTRHAPKAHAIMWDLLVIDEAHKLKNNQTLNYKFVKGIAKKRCLMLTATPLQNNIFELWALLDLLHPGFLGTLAQFRERYTDDGQGLRIKNEQDLQDKLAKIMIRNLRRDTGIRFPDRHVKSHLLEYSKEELAFYQEAISYIRREYVDLISLEKPQDVPEEDEDLDEVTREDLKEMAYRYRKKGLLSFLLIMLTRQITSSIKSGVEALKRYKETLEDDLKIKNVERIITLGEQVKTDCKIDYLRRMLKKEKEKVIIFTTFMHTQKIIQMELALEGFSTVLFNGKMNPEEKEAAIAAFKEDRQILICTDAGSEGRNLQFAHKLINFDLPWNPMRVEQRIGRVHRIGQKSSDVYIHNFAIRDTIEGYILNRLYEKIRLFEVSVGEMDMILSELRTNKDIEQQLFESYVGDERAYDVAGDFEQAKEKVEKIKSFDADIFDKKKKKGKS